MHHCLTKESQTPAACRDRELSFLTASPDEDAPAPKKCTYARSALKYTNIDLRCLEGEKELGENPHH